MMELILLVLFAIYSAALGVSAIKLNSDLDEERERYQDDEEENDRELLMSHLEWLRYAEDRDSFFCQVADAIERLLECQMDVRQMSKEDVFEENKTYLWWDDLRQEWVTIKGWALNKGPAMLGKDYWTNVPGSPEE